MMTFVVLVWICLLIYRCICGVLIFASLIPRLPPSTGSIIQNAGGSQGIEITCTSNDWLKMGNLTAIWYMYVNLHIDRITYIVSLPPTHYRYMYACTKTRLVDWVQWTLDVTVWLFGTGRRSFYCNELVYSKCAKGKYIQVQVHVCKYSTIEF